MGTQPHTNKLPLLGILLLVIGQILPQVDFSIVNVALDVIGLSLNTDETGLVLIVALYGVSFAALIATGGKLGDRYGRKRLFMIGILGFCIASAVCGIATHIVIMWVGRILQGLCAALLLPQILATIHASLEGERHRYAIGIYTSVAGLSVVIGQVAGGWLVSANLWNLGWRIAFFINIPLCLIILIFGYFFIPETRSTTAEHNMDTQGIMLFILLLLLIMVPTSLGKHWPKLWWLLFGAIPCAAWLWRVEKKAENNALKPILPPSLLKTPKVITGFLSEITVTFAYPGYLFVTALCLQSELHFSSIESGNTFIALGILFFIGSLISKPLSLYIQDHHIYILGTLLTVVGFLGSIWLINHNHSTLKFYQLWWATGIIGFGNSIMLTSAYRIALSHVSKHHASEASSALATVQQGCFALGTAFAGSIYSYSISDGYLHAISLSVGSLSLLILLLGLPTNIKSANSSPKKAN